MFIVLILVSHSFESKPHKSLNYQIHITLQMAQIILLSYSITIYLSPTVPDEYFNLCFIISLCISLWREREINFQWPE